MKKKPKTKIQKNKAKNKYAVIPYPNEVWQMAKWIVGFSCEYGKSVPEKNPRDYLRVSPDLSELIKTHPEILKPILKINSIIENFKKDRSEHEDGFTKAFAHEKLKKIYSNYSKNKIDLAKLKNDIHANFAGHIAQNDLPKLYNFLEKTPKLKDPVTKSRELISKYLAISIKNLEVYEKTKMKVYFGLNFDLEDVFRQTLKNLFGHLEPETIEKMTTLFNEDHMQKTSRTNLSKK